MKKVLITGSAGFKGINNFMVWFAGEKKFLTSLKASKQ